MAINENWNIRSRAHACAHTAQPFADGETFMTVLVEDRKTGELLRRDYSLAGWAEVEPTLGSAFSVWRSEYEAVKTEAKPEIAEKESAENLLRRLCEEDSIMTENTRYILAVMLERKKQLKQTGTRDTEDASFLVYEHIKSGEVYIIRDPELKLAQIEEVQKEVSRLLAGGGEAVPPAADSGATVEAAAAETAAEGPEQAPEAEGAVEADGETPPAPEAEGAEISGDEAIGGSGLAELPAGDPEDEVLSGGEDDDDAAVVVDEVPEREASGAGVTSEEMAERGE